jgi:hypothetical protein
MVINIPTFSIARPPKNYPNWDFWFENKPSGNPARTHVASLVHEVGVVLAQEVLHLQRVLLLLVRAGPCHLQAGLFKFSTLMGWAISYFTFQLQLQRKFCKYPKPRIQSYAYDLTFHQPIFRASVTKPSNDYKHTNKHNGVRYLMGCRCNPPRLLLSGCSSRHKTKCQIWLPHVVLCQHGVSIAGNKKEKKKTYLGLRKK